MDDVIGGGTEREAAEAAVAVGSNRDQGTFIFLSVIDNRRAGGTGLYQVIDSQPFFSKSLRTERQIFFGRFFFTDGALNITLSAHGDSGGARNINRQHRFRRFDNSEENQFAVTGNGFRSVGVLDLP